MWNYVAIASLSIIVMGSFIFDYKQGRLRWKLCLILLIVISNIVSIYYQHREKEIEQERWSNAQWREDYRSEKLSSAIRESKEGNKDNILDGGYTETASGFLDMNYSRLKDLFGTNKMIKEQYLTIYFNEIDKIPDSYNFEEWKETEEILFNRMRQQLKGYFISRGGGVHRFESIESEFIKERSKCIKAKEREFMNNENKSTVY